MPLTTSAHAVTSSLSTFSSLTERICGVINRTTYPASPFQRVSAMREIKNAAPDNVESFGKLPHLRILEVLGASQASKYLEPVVAEKRSSNSTACVPMMVAVAEFKGPEVHGVVRFAQASDGHDDCSIEAVIDGLAPGAHGWSVHEFGDLTKGPLSTGPAYSFPAAHPTSLVHVEVQERNPERNEVVLGNLGSLWVDGAGHVQTNAGNNRITVADIIGRSVVLYGSGSGDGDGADASLTRVAAAVIARSARPSSVSPQLCNCDGSLLWQGNANTYT